jgi:hypothetical protein
MDATAAIIAKATEWVSATSQAGVYDGTPLSASGIALARRVGVSRPELIRVVVVDELPTPSDPELLAIAQERGLLTLDTDGLTLAYAVFMRRGKYADPGLLAHEFRHVHQYESLGSVRGFLEKYIPEVLQFGYYDAPMEVDARAHERFGSHG